MFCSIKRVELILTSRGTRCYHEQFAPHSLTTVLKSAVCSCLTCWSLLKMSNWTHFLFDMRWIKRLTSLLCWRPVKASELLLDPCEQSRPDSVCYSAVTSLCLSCVRSDSTGLISAEHVDGASRASRASCLFARRRTEGRRSGFRSCSHVIRNSIKRENEALNAFDPPLSPTLCPVVERRTERRLFRRRPQII